MRETWERNEPTARAVLQKRVDDQPHISREMVREAESIFHDHLRHVGLKHTGQRDTILRTFLDTRDHLSTDELYRLVQEAGRPHRIHHRLSHPETAVGVRPGQRSGL